MVVRYAASVSTREGAVSEAPALFHPIDACDDGAAVAVAVAVADNAVTSRDVWIEAEPPGGKRRDA